MAATVESLTGAMPSVYHNDHSRPEKPVIRALEEELSRVVRGRAANPKWIAGVMRHGYKGAAEIAATVDYLFAFAATTGKVGNHHFEAVYQAYIADRAVHDFMAEKTRRHWPRRRPNLTKRLSGVSGRRVPIPRVSSWKI